MALVSAYLCEVMVGCKGLTVLGSDVEDDGDEVDDDEEEDEDEEDVLDDFDFVSFEF
jgi:hypothetical protein